VIDICKANDIEVFERNFSLADVYAADEAFITGTFAGLTPVSQVDGRAIGSPANPVTDRLRNLYFKLIEAQHKEPSL
jgi:branched-chain amino acid aminotransferase